MKLSIPTFAVGLVAAAVWLTPASLFTRVLAAVCLVVCLALEVRRSRRAAQR